MQYVPHDYQLYAIEYIKSHPIAAVLLDMGLGKTSITLTALNDLIFKTFESHKVLVIAPLRVARDTWPSELQKWEHLRHIVASVVIGSESERKAALLKKADIYIINRENIQWLIEESKIPFDFDTVVIDELSSFKNYRSKRFKALMKVRPKIKRIVGLTGTPSGNGLMDLWAEYRLLDMGERLGKCITHYRSNFFTVDKHDGWIVYSYKILPGADEQIYSKISDITISMKSTEHIKMPTLIKSEYAVRLSLEEQERYNTLRDELSFEFGDGKVTTDNAASLSNKLCQMSNGAVYTADGNIASVHEQKLNALEDIIESSVGKPILVAYWYKHDFERITERLTKLNLKFTLLDTAESIDKWNRRELDVALIHPLSAGHGLNLQNGGSNLVWFGLTWSLELYQQTNARIWRQGQKSSTVVIQHIITKGTIDEQIIQALSQKNATQAALIEAVKINLSQSNDK